MKQVIALIAVATVFIISGMAPAPKETTLALVSKVILDVTRKAEGKDWQPAKRGEMLSAGERVRTGEKSIAVIKFKDNSMLRVREKTEVLLGEAKDAGTWQRTTAVEKGVIGFSIRKQQQGEEFRFTSPTSVASIRGTSGQFGATDTSDLLVVVEGLVRLTNKISSEAADVGAGFTGLSLRDGNLQVRPSTPEEKVAAQLSARTGDQDSRLEIELNDGSGGKKNIEIKFK